MIILVTGGCGFIGSHTVVALLEDGHQVIIFDNLSNSTKGVLKKIKIISGNDVMFYEGDIRNPEDLSVVFTNYKIDAVIHFAGLKSVSESILNPILYYHNNISGTVSLLNAMKKADVKNIIFSSSATVYGAKNMSPCSEKMQNGKPTNSYGESKLIIEKILHDIYLSDPSWSIIILRYFNPVGAHPSGLIGEDPLGDATNIMPIILDVASGKKNKLCIYGNDYNTHDGTCLRDFIHVVDLANGHLKALNNINEYEIEIINLGTGKPTSVLELVNAFEHHNDLSIPLEFSERRNGDLEEVWSDPSKAKEYLSWSAQLTIKDMVIDSWNFLKKN